MEYNGSLKNKNVEKKIIDMVLEELKNNFQNPQELKHNLEILNEICNLIENAVHDNKIKKINKLDLCLKICSCAFQLNDADKQIIMQNVEYLHSNGKIKRTKLIKKVVNILKGLLIKEAKK